MRYRTFGYARKNRVHIVNPTTGLSYCRAENNGQILSREDHAKQPKYRPVCTICQQVRQSAPPIIRDAGTFVTVEKGKRIWTIGKQCPWFAQALAEIREGKC